MIIIGLAAYLLICIILNPHFFGMIQEAITCNNGDWKYTFYRLKEWFLWPAPVIIVAALCWPSVWSYVIIAFLIGYALKGKL